MPTPLDLAFKEKAAPENSAGGAPIAPVPVGRGTEVKPDGTGYGAVGSAGAGAGVGAAGYKAMGSVGLAPGASGASVVKPTWGTT